MLTNMLIALRLLHMQTRIYAKFNYGLIEVQALYKGKAMIEV